MSGDKVEVLLLGGPCDGQRGQLNPHELRYALVMPYLENPDAPELERTYAQKLYSLRETTTDEFQRYGVSWVGVP